MNLNRRQFFKFGTASSSGAALFGADKARAAPETACPSSMFPATAELHLGCQQMLCPGQLRGALRISRGQRIDRVEINGGNWSGLAKNADEMAAAIQNRKLRFSVTCISARGNAGMADPVERRAVIDTTKSILESAARLGATGVITVPARKKIDLPFPELRERYLAEILP